MAGKEQKDGKMKTTLSMRKIWWTWDIRCRWSHGFCLYEESFLKNYRAMIDHAGRFGVEGIIIWGFLRDKHGGIEAAKRVVDYAQDKGVNIYPGVGVDDYGGVYYEGDSEYSLHNYLQAHPDAQALREDGTPDTHRWPPTDQNPKLKGCPSNDKLIEYYHESVAWLLETFQLKGFQIEQGDSGVCWCDRCKAKRSRSSSEGKTIDDEAAARRIPQVVAPFVKANPNLTVISETYSGLTDESLSMLGHMLNQYQPQITLSWQLYNGPTGSDNPDGYFRIDETVKSPRSTGCAALRTNNDLFLGEIDDRKGIRKALQLSKRAGLTMTYIYGEYPCAWPITAANYEVWSENA